MVKDCYLNEWIENKVMVVFDIINDDVVSIKDFWWVEVGLKFNFCDKFILLNNFKLFE